MPETRRKLLIFLWPKRAAAVIGTSCLRSRLMRRSDFEFAVSEQNTKASFRRLHIFNAIIIFHTPQCNTQQILNI